MSLSSDALIRGNTRVRDTCDRAPIVSILSSKLSSSVLETSLMHINVKFGAWA
jgi:hypothetical protein